ncbi:hypothetical protein G6F37_005454 [Rhizopus arrhizus]|nr:hypothetical protein G6F37_005454 [Rhizopus arrhizus]
MSTSNIWGHFTLVHQGHATPSKSTNNERAYAHLTKQILPSCRLSQIGILDTANHHLKKIINNQLEIKELDILRAKVKLNEGIPDKYSLKLLDSIKQCGSSYILLRKLLRILVVPVDEFDAIIHHNVLTVESILMNFSSILEFNDPLITDEYYERTCATSVVVPVVSALFMKFRLLSTKWFEKKTQITNRHLFDAVIFYKDMKEPMALGEFAGPMQNNDKTDHDTVKVYRNAMRVRYPKFSPGVTLLLAMLSACTTTTTIQASPHQIVLSIPPPSVASVVEQRLIITDIE